MIMIKNVAFEDYANKFCTRILINNTGDAFYDWNLFMLTSGDLCEILLLIN